jgi:hypothetical protein
MKNHLKISLITGLALLFMGTFASPELSAARLGKLILRPNTNWKWAHGSYKRKCQFDFKYKVPKVNPNIFRQIRPIQIQRINYGPLKISQTAAVQIRVSGTAKISNTMTLAEALKLINSSEGTEDRRVTGGGSGWFKSGPGGQGAGYSGFCVRRIHYFLSQCE